MNRQKSSLKSRSSPPPFKTELPPPSEMLSTMNLDESTKDELEFSLEMKKIGKEMEDYVKNRRIAFEEKMFERFYLMRIEQSRQFIDLIRKVNKSWDDFVDYLQAMGAQGASGDGDCTVYSLTNSNSVAASSQATNGDAK